MLTNHLHTYTCCMESFMSKIFRFDFSSFQIAPPKKSKKPTKNELNIVQTKKYPRIGVGGYGKTVWSWVNRNTTSILKLYLSFRNNGIPTLLILCKYFSCRDQWLSKHYQLQTLKLKPLGFHTASKSFGIAHLSSAMNEYLRNTIALLQ